MAKYISRKRAVDIVKFHGDEVTAWIQVSSLPAVEINTGNWIDGSNVYIFCNNSKFYETIV